jgi:hypothetical protein
MQSLSKIRDHYNDGDHVNIRLHSVVGICFVASIFSVVVAKFSLGGYQLLSAFVVSFMGIACMNHVATHTIAPERDKEKGVKGSDD